LERFISSEVTSSLFSQFFARHVKPGKRPIDGPGDDNVIVSPADSVFHGQCEDLWGQVLIFELLYRNADLLLFPLLSYLFYPLPVLE